MQQRRVMNTGRPGYMDFYFKEPVDLLIKDAGMLADWILDVNSSRADESPMAEELQEAARRVQAACGEGER